MKKWMLAALAAASFATLAAAEEVQGPSAERLGQINAQIQSQSKGFVAGPIVNKTQFVVFFDPQCPHCADLWRAYEPLLGKAKMVWVPVAFVSKKSAPQAAALLASSDPVKAMGEHEKSMKDGKGGIEPVEPGANVKQILDSNAKTLMALGVDRVPFVTGVNPKTGKVVSWSGSMSTAQLAEMMGVSETK